METVIQGLLGIAVSLGLAGCLVQTPPGVPPPEDTETARIYYAELWGIEDGVVGLFDRGTIQEERHVPLE